MTERRKTIILWIAAAALLCAIVVLSYCYKPSFGVKILPRAEDPSVPTENIPCNINTATVGQLEQIDGIDREIALNIVAFREEYGRFTSMDSLLQVNGVTHDLLRKTEGYLSCW